MISSKRSIHTVIHTRITCRKLYFQLIIEYQFDNFTVNFHFPILDISNFTSAKMFSQKRDERILLPQKSYISSTPISFHFTLIPIHFHIS